MVTYQLWIGDTTPGGPPRLADVVQPATGATDAVIRLRSTSTRDGVTTTVEAIVAVPAAGQRRRTNASPSTRPGWSTDWRSLRVDGVGWEQVQRGVELPFDPRITIPQLHEIQLDVPSPDPVADVEATTRAAVVERLRVGGHSRA